MLKAIKKDLERRAGLQLGLEESFMRECMKELQQNGESPKEGSAAETEQAASEHSYLNSSDSSLRMDLTPYEAMLESERKDGGERLEQQSFRVQLVIQSRYNVIDKVKANVSELKAKLVKLLLQRQFKLKVTNEQLMDDFRQVLLQVDLIQKMIKEEFNCLRSGDEIENRDKQLRELTKVQKRFNAYKQTYKKQFVSMKQQIAKAQDEELLGFGMVSYATKGSPASFRQGKHPSANPDSNFSSRATGQLPPLAQRSKAALQRLLRRNSKLASSGTSPVAKKQVKAYTKLMRIPGRSPQSKSKNDGTKSRQGSSPSPKKHKLLIKPPTVVPLAPTSKSTSTLSLQLPQLAKPPGFRRPYVTHLQGYKKVLSPAKHRLSPCHHQAKKETMTSEAQVLMNSLIQARLDPSTKLKPSNSASSLRFSGSLAKVFYPMHAGIKFRPVLKAQSSVFKPIKVPAPKPKVKPEGKERIQKLNTMTQGSELNESVENLSNKELKMVISKRPSALPRLPAVDTASGRWPGRLTLEATGPKPV